MKKSLIALLAALVLLGLVLFFNKKNEATHGRVAYAFDSTQAGQVAQVLVIKAPDTSRLEFKDGAWVVGLDAFPVDTGKINKVLNTLYRLQSHEVVSSNPERAAEYGLDSANIKHVSWKDKAGKDLGHVAIGKTSGADYNSTYWKFADKPEVYRTPGNFTWEILTRDNEWKDKKLIGREQKDIKFIETNWKDSAGLAFGFRIEAVNDSTWRMLSPQANPVKRDLAQEMASRLASLNIDDFLAAGDTNKTKSEIDSPMVAIKVDFKDGKSLELKAGKAFEGFTYIRHPARSDTVKVSNWQLDVFKKKPFELMEPIVDTTLADSSKTDSSAMKKAGAN